MQKNHRRLMAAPAALPLATALGLASERLAIKAGLLVGLAFPLMGLPVYYGMLRSTRKNAA